MISKHKPTECMKCGSRIIIRETDWSESSAYCYPCAATKFYSYEEIPNDRGSQANEDQHLHTSTGQG